MIPFLCLTITGGAVRTGKAAYACAQPATESEDSDGRQSCCYTLDPRDDTYHLKRVFFCPDSRDLVVHHDAAAVVCCFTTSHQVASSTSSQHASAASASSSEDTVLLGGATSGGGQVAAVNAGVVAPVEEMVSTASSPQTSTLNVQREGEGAKKLRLLSATSLRHFIRHGVDSCPPQEPGQIFAGDTEECAACCEEFNFHPIKVCLPPRPRRIDSVTNRSTTNRASCITALGHLAPPSISSCTGARPGSSTAPNHPNVSFETPARNRKCCKDQDKNLRPTGKMTMSKTELAKADEKYLQEPYGVVTAGSEVGLERMELHDPHYDEGERRQERVFVLVEQGEASSSSSSSSNASTGVGVGCCGREALLSRSRGRATSPLSSFSSPGGSSSIMTAAPLWSSGASHDEDIGHVGAHRAPSSPSDVEEEEDSEEHFLHDQSAAGDHFPAPEQRGRSAVSESQVELVDHKMKKIIRGLSDHFFSIRSPLVATRRPFLLQSEDPAATGRVPGEVRGRILGQTGRPAIYGNEQGHACMLEPCRHLVCKTCAIKYMQASCAEGNHVKFACMHCRSQPQAIRPLVRLDLLENNEQQHDEMEVLREDHIIPFSTAASTTRTASSSSSRSPPAPSERESSSSVVVGDRKKNHPADHSGTAQKTSSGSSSKTESAATRSAISRRSMSMYSSINEEGDKSGTSPPAALRIPTDTRSSVAAEELMYPSRIAVVGVDTTTRSPQTNKSESSTRVVEAQRKTEIEKINKHQAARPHQAHSAQQAVVTDFASSTKFGSSRASSSIDGSNERTTSPASMITSEANANVMPPPATRTSTSSSIDSPPANFHDDRSTMGAFASTAIGMSQVVLPCGRSMSADSGSTYFGARSVDTTSQDDDEVPPYTIDLAAPHVLPRSHATSRRDRDFGHTLVTPLLTAHRAGIGEKRAQSDKFKKDLLWTNISRK
ncbi:unnamed protein product [Amoebophrya sp. A25]|nr:unnamed protein product [Amoebophrya sp. A25]|eukprot:GSA25T00018923001.1